jgi:RNA polymerase sigma-70 factor (ECF subfamily)
VSTPLPDEQAFASPYSQLLDRARQRDPEAFTRLYDATHGRVFGYVLAHVGEQAAAEDLLQEIYLGVLRSIGRFRGRSEGEFMAWIFKIARAKLADRLRSRYRRPEVALDDVESPAQMADPLNAIDQRDRARELATALMQLTPDQRDVVVSRMVMGFDLEETGRLLGKNVGSVKALQHRALARLAALLGPEGNQNG